MVFAGPPSVASWRHEGSRNGFEVTFFSRTNGGLLVEGATSATDDGASWIVGYEIRLDPSWVTRSARVTRRSRGASITTVISADGKGRWEIDGAPAPRLAGCLDLDLEASAVTNAFPVHRLSLADGAQASAPAVYVPALGPAVDRLEQTYTRLGESHYAYAAPAFEFECGLVYDQYGLIVDYPGIATRVQ